jgi:hypothetical protein
MIIYTPVPHLNIIMCTSPKCACQTFDRIVLRLFKHPYFNTLQIGNPTTDTDRITAQQIGFRAVLKSNDNYKKLITTRNPLKRIISCYNYMILGRHRYTHSSRSGQKWFKGAIEEKLRKSLYDVSFPEFIDYIHKTPDGERDIHFSTQSHMVEDVEFDYIIKLENFKDDMKAAIKELSLPLALPPLLQKNKTNYQRFNRECLTEDLLNKIYDIYSLDQDKFRHEKLELSYIKKYLQDRSCEGPLFQPPATGDYKKWQKVQ